MARIAGVDIPKSKKIGTALTYIFGIGPTTARKILAEAHVSPDLRTTTLTEDQVARIRDVIDANYRVEGDLRKEVSMNIKRLMHRHGVAQLRPPGCSESRSNGIHRLKVCLPRRHSHHSP